MNQFEFGTKVCELRKQKGFTQATLAEKCNMNIRSIQRIETGKVIPRAYTINILSQVLEYNLGEIQIEAVNNFITIIDKVESFLNSNLILHKTINRKNNNMNNILKISWIAGILIFAISIPETVFNVTRYYDYLSAAQIPLYIIVCISAMIINVLFMRGFVMIGSLLKNNIIIVCSYLMIISIVVGYSYEIISLSYDSEERKLIYAVFSVIDGFLCIFFGIGLLRIEDMFGSTSKYAGLLNIIAGITFILVVLFFIGLIIMIPVTILEILILYKAYTKFDSLQQNVALAK